jgi:hypothetical protein
LQIRRPDPDVPADLRRALGEAVGATVTFRLDVDDPNGPVRIDEG